MCFKFSILNFLLLILYILTNQTECKDSPGRFLGCTGRTLRYQTFVIDYYFTSKDKRDQHLKKDSVFGPDDIDFDPRRRTAVIIHGFMGTGQDTLINYFKNRFVKWADMNTIVVSWERGHPNPLLYDQAVVNTEYAALQIQSLFDKFIKYFNNTDKSVENWGPLHFVGFSLGAHVAGLAADLLRRKNNLLVNRVTGLDPADPCYEDANFPLRLSKTHAKFVDVIHSDGAKIKNDGFGIYEPIGHVDFYLNGGIVQPGCDSLRTTRKFAPLNVFQLVQHSLNQGACHHSRALEVFYQSVRQDSKNGCKFWAHPWRLGSSKTETYKILQKKCDSSTCVEMGINAELYNHTTNIYYVSTTGSKPYCNVKIA